MGVTAYQTYNRAIYHGGDISSAAAKFGGEISNWIDLSTGINPHSYPVPNLAPRLWQQLPGTDVEDKLLDSARSYYQAPNIFGAVAAPGTQSLLQRLPECFAKSRVLILSPTYAEHKHCWQAGGHTVVDVIDPTDKTTAVDILVIVNPNNPTGQYFSKSEIADLRRTFVKPDGLLVIDEAFMDLTPELSALQSTPPKNTLILKSFGKFFGLAGVRLGFAFGNAALTETLKQKLGPWAVSGVACEIGRHAYSNAAWIAPMRRQIQNEATRLSGLLAEHKIAVSGNAGLFLLTRNMASDELFNHLCQHHILTRPFADHPDFLRFGLPGNEADWERLEAALNARP